MLVVMGVVVLGAQAKGPLPVQPLDLPYWTVYGKCAVVHYYEVVVVGRGMKSKGAQ